MDTPYPNQANCCVPVRAYPSHDLVMQWQIDHDTRRRVLKAVSARRAISNDLRDNPDMLRRYQPPPPIPQSVALLTALGYLQDLRNGEAVDDLDELPINAGIALWEIRPLILKAEEKGYLTFEDGAIALTPKGWKWYEKHGSG